MLEGVSFQQIQKYERGTNRISSSNLYQFSKILQVSVNYFFDELEPSDDKIILEQKSKESVTLLNLYCKIKDESIRKKVLSIIKNLVD